MQENSKVFNRIPLLALVHNRIGQNDGRISVQKQTSNNKRQSNLKKLVIAMSFVSEKVLLFDPHFEGRNAPELFGHAINILRDFMSSVCYLEELPASRENICPKKN